VSCVHPHLVQQSGQDGLCFPSCVAVMSRLLAKKHVSCRSFTVHLVVWCSLYPIYLRITGLNHNTGNNVPCCDLSFFRFLEKKKRHAFEPWFLVKNSACTKMEFLDINLTTRVFCSMLLTIPSTGGLKIAYSTPCCDLSFFRFFEKKKRQVFEP
jgi:hypothetical protein